MDVPPSPISPPEPAGFFRRKDFPNGFVFGSATSAFQVEGALQEGNRGPSTWDDYSNKHNLYFPYKEDAVGSYYHYKEDVSIIKEVGFDAYRFSISWSRVMPNGREENEEGIAFYDKLLDELQANGIEPYVTIWHFDYPQALEDEYGGFLSSKIVEDFKTYADLCFRRFGNKVKNWITLNEPITFCFGAYLDYNMAPGEPVDTATTPSRSSLKRSNASKGITPFCRRFDQLRARSPLVGKKRSYDAISGDAPSSKIARVPDAGRDPYTAAHNLLLCHVTAVQLYKENYQSYQRGQIGITLVSYWCVPYSDLDKDKEAAERALEFMLGWFMEPLTKGKYPDVMRNTISDGRLPEFTDEQSALFREYPFDFLGMNYYTSVYVADDSSSPGGDWKKDLRASLLTERDGKPIGDPTPSTWLYLYPRGIMDLLLYTKMKYNNPVIYITENGVMEQDDSSLPLWKALYDYNRISFYYTHLWYVRQAIWLGVNVKGYFQWALLDNLEWSNGFNLRFGINYVDYKDGAKKGSTRYPKLSAGWFKFLCDK